MILIGRGLDLKKLCGKRKRKVEEVSLTERSRLSCVVLKVLKGEEKAQRKVQNFR